MTTFQRQANRFIGCAIDAAGYSTGIVAAAVIVVPIVSFVADVVYGNVRRICRGSHKLEDPGDGTRGNGNGTHGGIPGNEPIIPEPYYDEAHEFENNEDAAVTYAPADS